MPNILNVKNNCISSPGNTGVGNCFNNLGIIRGVIFGQPGAAGALTASTVPAFKTALATAILVDNPAARARPLQDIFEITDGSAAPIEFTQPATQKKVVTADGFAELTLRWGNGGMCLLIALRKGNGKNTGVMFFDNNGLLWGTKSSVADSIEFIPVYNYTPPIKLQTQPSEFPGYMTMLSFDPYFLNDNLALIDFSNDGGLGYLAGLNGLQDVVISQGNARSTNVLTAKAKTACGTVDLYTLYSTQLAATAAWVVTNATTGNPVAITSVTASATYQGWVITVNSSDPNYTATAGGLLIGLTGPTELAGLSVGGATGGFESNKLAQ